MLEGKAPQWVVEHTGPRCQEPPEAGSICPKQPTGTEAPMEFFATCPLGFERLLADELTSLRTPHVRPLKGQVAFDGELADAYRVCLWSHLASRVVAVLARTEAGNSDALYDGLSQIAWEQHLPAGASFAIDAHGTNAQLRNTQFVALRSKDAVTDRLLARTGARPITNVDAPDLQVVVRISRDRATVGIDLAGEALFRRGYEATRTSSALPSLRPDYAAALLACGGWPQLAQDGATLVAPFCGGGTITCEAACWALDRAPGLLRGRWGFMGWRLHDADAWQRLLDEARQRAHEAEDRELHLVLDDPRAGFETANRQALRAAGIATEPAFGPGGPRHGGSSTLLACDLSWIADHETAAKASAVEAMARLGAGLSRGSRASVLATDALADLVLGEASDTTRVLVGRDEATLRRYDTPSQGTSESVRLPDGSTVGVLVPGSAQFAARLAKVYRQRRKWARREDVSCYRIYDADLPDYAVSIDLFEGSSTPGRWLQVYEYAAPKDIDETKARARLLDVVAIAPRLLDVRPEDTFVRVRTKARGGSQYADEAREVRRPGRGRSRTGGPALSPGAHLVDEGGLTFEVNFSTRLDCGIFLDHRETRAMLREMAKQTKGSKRFLNLFAYTGTGTCYAADGGARHTTTVDLSAPSLAWAQRNMERNGFTGPEHEYVQADVIAWVGEQRRTKNRWDLVFCDVPTFSNSSRMRKASFDVQRDHAELLIGVSRLLTRDGTCVFSCNLRSFKLDEEALAKAGVEAQDITAQTIPEDFSRNQRIHKCYLVRRTPREQ